MNDNETNKNSYYIEVPLTILENQIHFLNHQLSYNLELPNNFIKASNWIISMKNFYYLPHKIDYHLFTAVDWVSYLTYEFQILIHNMYRINKN